MQGGVAESSENGDELRAAVVTTESVYDRLAPSPQCP
jgi:hypothetical protein